MKADLAALRAADQFRDLAVPAGVQLNSNDYLGLSGHPRLKEAIARALETDDRFASTGSRLLSGHHQRWEQLEAEFAAFVGAEAALFFSSGYAANVGLLSSVLKPEDIVFSDASNHASLIDGIRLSGARKVIFPHLDLNFLEDALRRLEHAGRKVVVVEHIFSMDGDHAPLDDLKELCERFDASWIVDEAHSVGVETAPYGGALASVYPCGKALASMGAFVTGSQTLRDYLINHARPFIFSTALPPYCAAHLREAIALVSAADRERAHLQELGEYLRQKLRDAGCDIGRSDSQIIPIVLGANETALRFAAAASAAGFSIRAIRPPTVPNGTARLRVSLNAKLSIADLDRFVETLVVAGLEEGTIPSSKEGWSRRSNNGTLP
ncbi:MAG TPA: 8-amino-7-oxononanoate synthase [Terriglobia bacterium]|nr:8-amino-7-oxononanoate synthase [Terriglobia bacterium]